jgi:hypothetical protein
MGDKEFNFNLELTKSCVRVLSVNYSPALQINLPSFLLLPYLGRRRKNEAPQNIFIVRYKISFIIFAFQFTATKTTKLIRILDPGSGYVLRTGT